MAPRNAGLVENVVFGRRHPVYVQQMFRQPLPLAEGQRERRRARVGNTVEIEEGRDVRLTLRIVAVVLDEIEHDIRWVAPEHTLDHAHIVLDVDSAGLVPGPPQPSNDRTIFLHDGRDMDVVFGDEGKRLRVDLPNRFVFVFAHVIEQNGDGGLIVGHRDRLRFHQ